MLRTLRLGRLMEAFSKSNTILSKTNQGISCNLIAREYGIYEPDYLHLLRPEVPVYDLINIQMTGYDYPILENYQRFIHHVCESLDLSVEDGWALPAKEETITRFKPCSSIVETSYTLKTYKRVVQVSEVKAHLTPLLLRLIQAGQPEGVDLHVVEHTDMHDLERYVPDKDLKTLKEQLTEMGGPSKASTRR